LDLPAVLHNALPASSVSQLTQLAAPSEQGNPGERQRCPSHRMTNGKDAEICEFCQQGNVFRRNDPMSFHQWTDRGYVRCRVTIPMGICDHCETKTWDEAAEAVIEQAVREAYDRLS
jgi:hypothetical protein